MKLEIRPITFRAACAFVAELHRHNKPPRGHKFSIACQDGDRVVGVAMAGRPVARSFDDGITLEVNRTCTDGTEHANSKLYGAVWRAAKAMGYKRCITYTQGEESGASLRAAGWRKVKRLKPRGSWAESTGNERLKAMRDVDGNGGVERVLWEITVEWLPYCRQDGHRPSGTGGRLVELERRDGSNPIGFGDELRWSGALRWRYREDLRNTPALWSSSCTVCFADMERPVHAKDIERPVCVICQEARHDKG